LVLQGGDGHRGGGSSGSLRYSAAHD
jgi:hypothetical protein